MAALISDLADRLTWIEKQADKVRCTEGATGNEKDLAYMVCYLAAILKKHLETGET